MLLTNRFYQLFSLQGRISRPDYFINWVFIFLFCIIFIYLPSFIEIKTIDTLSQKLLIMTVTSLNLIASIATLMALIGTHVKRLHDMNCRGWWTLLFFTPLNPLIILVCLFVPGSQSTNRFGNQTEL